MSYYLIFLGEFCLTNRETLTYKWSDLYKGDYTDCQKKFLSDMISVFSQYGQNYENIQLSDIKSSRVIQFELITNGNSLDLKPIREDLESRPCHKCRFRADSNNYQEMISYSTLGGLNLSLSALLISPETLIRYIPS